jgi:hypothetical protein
VSRFCRNPGRENSKSLLIYSLIGRLIENPAGSGARTRPAVVFSQPLPFAAPARRCNISGIYFIAMRSANPHLTGLPHLVRYLNLPLSAADNVAFRVVLQGSAD